MLVQSDISEYPIATVTVNRFKLEKNLEVVINQALYFEDMEYSSVLQFLALLVVILMSISAVEMREKQWWDYSESIQNAGKCGEKAPLYNGIVPICNPDSLKYHCCSEYGYCGSGPDYCDCPTCVDHRKDPKPSPGGDQPDDDEFGYTFKPRQKPRQRNPIEKITQSVNNVSPTI